MLYDPKWEITVTPIKTIEPWQQLLIDAADLIEKKGWIQSAYKSQFGYCTLGALRVVYQRQKPDHAYIQKSDHAYMEAQVKLRQTLGTDIAGWNDSSCRSKEQVVQMLLFVAGAESSPYAPNRKIEQIVVDSSSWTGRY